MEHQVIEIGSNSEPVSEPALRIGFDGKRAVKNLTGLGNYSRWLITQLAVNYPQHQYFIYASAIKKSNRIKKFLEHAKIILKKPANTFLWRSVGILKDLARDQVDLYHGLSHEIPFTTRFSKLKTVVTIHDLIFLRFPQHYKFLDKVIYKFKSKYACENADKIIAISERTKADIIEYYNIPEHKIEVIYQSCDDSFKKLLTDDAKKQVSAKYKLPEKYVLYVGTIESRKNLVALVKALKDIDQTYSLVVVGRKTRYYGKVKAALIQQKMEDRVQFFQHMPFSDLPAVYQNAAVFILPSYYEGFGIPVIEALYSGVPVIAATGSCMEEAGGPHSIYLAPDDSEGIATAVNSIINSPELSSTMTANGLKYVQKFNNQTLTTQLMDCYLKVLEK